MIFNFLELLNQYLFHIFSFLYYFKDTRRCRGLSQQKKCFSFISSLWLH